VGAGTLGPLSREQNVINNSISNFVRSTFFSTDNANWDLKKRSFCIKKVYSKRAILSSVSFSSIDFSRDPSMGPQYFPILTIIRTHFRKTGNVFLDRF